MKAIKKLFKWGFIALGILVVVGVIAAVAGGGEDSTTDTGGKTEQPAKKETSVTKANYDKIVVGDTLTGEGGMTIDEVIAILGEPEDKIESSMSGVNGDEVKMIDMTWYTLDFESINISFTNGKVSHKLWMD